MSIFWEIIIEIIVLCFDDHFHPVFHFPKIHVWSNDDALLGPTACEIDIMVQDL